MSYLFDLILKGTVELIFLTIFAIIIEQIGHRKRLIYKA